MTTDDPWMEEQLLLLEQLEEDAALVTREEFRARADALGCTLDELVADTVQRTRRRRLFARRIASDACKPLVSVREQRVVLREVLSELYTDITGDED